jgi:7-cyano-7-deazaguanine synthase in queuosine biosynthesis
MNQKKSIVLTSGGLDSFISWYLFRSHNCKSWKYSVDESDEISVNVFVDIGHKYIDKERTAVNNLQSSISDFELIEHKGSQIGKFELEPSGIIPSRNAELILCGSQYGEDIYFGVIKDEINSDKSLDFIKSMEDVLNISNRKQYWTEGTTFSIKTPTIKYNKTELVKMYLEYGGLVDHLQLTVSCYSETVIHCGSCPSCFKRYVAFTNNEISFETENNPVEWAKSNGIVEKCNDGTYSSSRSIEILTALSKRK